MAKKPSEKLDDLMMGRTAWEDTDPAIRSWAGFFIYDAANRILAQPKEKRRGMIDRVPAKIRGRVEQEVIRVARMR